MKTPGRLRPHRVLRGSGIWESICHLGGFKEQALYWQRNRSPSAWKASISLLFLCPPSPSQMGTLSLLARGHPHTPTLIIFAVLGRGYNVSCTPLQVPCPCITWQVLFPFLFWDSFAKLSRWPWIHSVPHPSPELALLLPQLSLLVEL